MAHAAAPANKLGGNQLTVIDTVVHRALGGG